MKQHIYILSLCSRGLNQEHVMVFNREPQKEEVLRILVEMTATEYLTDEFVTEMIVALRRDGLPRITSNRDFCHREWTGGTGYSHLRRAELMHLPTSNLREEGTKRGGPD